MATATEDEQPKSWVYCRDRDDRSPFADNPSGSHWGRPHVCWLGIRYEWDCPAEKIFTKKSTINKNGAIIKYLEENIMLPWVHVTAGRHDPGSFYDCLYNLESPIETRPSYKPANVLLSSSPVPPSSSLDPDSPSRRLPQSREASSPPESSTSEPRQGRPSRHSPSSRPNYRESGSSSASEGSVRDEFDEYKPQPGSPSSESETEDAGAPGAEYRLEKDVDLAAAAFLHLLRSAFTQTEIGLSEEEDSEQDLRYEFK